MIVVGIDAVYEAVGNSPLVLFGRGLRDGDAVSVVLYIVLPLCGLHKQCVCKRGRTMHEVHVEDERARCKRERWFIQGPLGVGPNHRFELAGGVRAQSCSRSTLACPGALRQHLSPPRRTMHYFRETNDLCRRFSSGRANGALLLLHARPVWSCASRLVHSSAQPFLCAWPACWLACSCTTSGCSAD